MTNAIKHIPFVVRFRAYISLFGREAQHTERGFTIVELLIVIIVIGILATLVLIAYSNVQSQARDTRRQSNAVTLKDVAVAYKGASFGGAYPRNTAGGTDWQTDISTASNYMSGNASIIANMTITSNIQPTTAPSATNPDYILTQYCGTANPLTNTNATGMKFTYWSEIKGALQPPVTTGTGC